MKNLIKVAVVGAGLFFAGNTASAQQKIGHINVNDLIQSMPEIKTAQSTLDALSKAKETELQLMDSERQKKITSFTDKQKTITDANRDALTKELTTLSEDIEDIQKRLTDTQQKAQTDLQTKQNELLQPIYQKADNAIRAIASEKKYTYVLDISQQSVVYFDGGDDLLPAVKAKLGISATAPAAAATPAAAAPAPAAAAPKK